MTFWQLLLAIGLPSAIVSAVCAGMVKYLLYRLERREEEQRKKDEAREKDRHRLEVLQIKGTLAAMALGEATVTALKNGHPNGECERAMEYQTAVKHEIRDFMTEKGIESVV